MPEIAFAPRDQNTEGGKITPKPWEYAVAYDSELIEPHHALADRSIPPAIAVKMPRRVFIKLHIRAEPSRNWLLISPHRRFSMPVFSSYSKKVSGQILSLGPKC